MPDHLEWLRQSAAKMECYGMSLVHGGWIDPLDEYLTDVSREYFANERAAYFFSGHTHVQSLSLLDGICHCNPGSVGQPRDADARAAFALFDGEKVYLKRVDYNIDLIAAQMKTCGFSIGHRAPLTVLQHPRLVVLGNRAIARLADIGGRFRLPLVPA